MNVVIIGLPNTNGEQIKGLATTLTENGISVRYPTSDAVDVPDDIAIIESFERIDWSDAVIAVPKDGLSFAMRTSSEMAYARHQKKPILIYYS